MRDQDIVSALTLRDLTVSFYLRRRCVRVACGLVLAIALATTLGCRRRPAALARAAAEPPERLRAALALVPADAGIVLALDVAGMRALPLGKALLALPTEVMVGLDRWLRAIVGSGLDRTQHLLAALPAERHADDRMLLVIEAEQLERTSAEAWLAARKSAGVAGVQIGARLIVARGAWAAALAPTATTPADPSELIRLCRRAARHQHAWFATVVPPGLRTRLLTEARFADVAAIARLWGAIGLDHELHIALTAETSNHADARTLVQRLEGFVSEAKRHPDLLAQGLAPHLEALRLEQHGPLARATLAIPADQAANVLARVAPIMRAHWPSEP